MNKLLIAIVLITLSLFGMVQIANAEKVNLWIAISTQAVDEYIEKGSDPAYSGPMDDVTFSTLSKMADRRVVQNLFKPVDAAGKTYKLFSINVEGSAKAKAAIDDLTEKWPTHFIMLGAWWSDGRQVGTEIVEGEVTGTPIYPIHAQTYKFMRDTASAWDAEGNVTATTPASSNADLRDVNVMTWQAFRNFD